MLKNLPATCLLIVATGWLFIAAKRAGGSNMTRVDLSGQAQGTTWHITYFTAKVVVTQQQVDSILMAIDSSLSIYKPYSTISLFNNSAGGIEMDLHFKNVIERSLEIYHQTSGYFDITIYPIVDAWGFSNRPFIQPPDSATIKSLMECVGSGYLEVQNNFLHKLKPCVKIDVNSIAQGYSVDVVAAFLRTNMIDNYLVEIGGEIQVHGNKYPGLKPFTIGIERPGDDESAPGTIEKELAVKEGGITTSGNYRKYLQLKGKKWSHLMDPHKGYPAENELISVTVFAKDAFTADAYDTPLMIMGLQKALHFVEGRKELAAFFIYKRSDGKILDTSSRSFNTLFNNAGEVNK